MINQVAVVGFSRDIMKVVELEQSKLDIFSQKEWT